MEMISNKFMKGHQDTISELHGDRRRQIKSNITSQNLREKIMKDFKSPQLLTQNLSLKSPVINSQYPIVMGNWEQIIKPSSTWVSEEENIAQFHFDWEWVHDPTEPHKEKEVKVGPAVRALTMSLVGNCKGVALCTQTVLTHIASWDPTQPILSININAPTLPFRRRFRCGFYYGNTNHHHNAFCYIGGISPEFQAGDHASFNAYLLLDVYSVSQNGNQEQIYSNASQIMAGYSGNNDVDNMGNPKPWYGELDTHFVSSDLEIPLHNKISFVSTLVFETKVVGSGISYVHFNKGTTGSYTDMVDPLHVQPTIQLI